MVVRYKKYFGIVLSLFVLLTPAFVVRAEFDGYPVVIVPGMLASFDKKLMYQDKEDNKWSFVPFGNVYKALIKKLEKSGYEEGKTLFIAYYDWRKPVSENWEKYLKPKIEEAKQKSGRDHVDLVAHSMGGLLSRAYIQSDNYGNDVNKFVMMGTPNYGAAESYVVWEGGLYPQNWSVGTKWFANGIQNSLRKTRNKKDLKQPLSFREFFPSIKDLLPTTPFAKKDGELLDLSGMADENDFLISLNDNVDLLEDRVREVRTYSGHTGKTMDQIILGNKSPDDESSMRWRDGHPNPEVPTADSDNGDETVLVSSASIPEIFNETLDGTSHTKIPDDARNKISWFLNPPVQVQRSTNFLLANFFNRFFASSVQADDVNPDEYVEPDAMLSFTVSPNVAFEVVDPDGKILSRTKNEIGDDAYFDDDPDDDTDITLVVIRNPKAGKYTLNLNGNSAGDYYIDSTYVNSDGNFEDSNDGTIEQGGTKTLEATVSETDGVALPSGDDETTDNPPTSENKKEITSGPNTALDKKNKKVGSVLGAATVRTKLSDTIISVQNKLTVLLNNKKANEPKITKTVYQTLMGPLNDMLARARMYETAVAEKKTKLAESLMIKIKGDYRDFANKVDTLIATGKLNKQTTDVLVALKQRLEKAGMK